MVLEYLPLVGVLAVLAIISLAPMSRPVDRVLTRIAIATFGPYVESHAQVNARQRRRLQETHRGQTYQSYASKTFLYTAIMGAAGSILGVYATAASLIIVQGLSEQQASAVPEQIASLASTVGPSLGPFELFFILLASSATVGVIAAVCTYQLRWSILTYIAGERRRRIDASIQRNVAFIYALSRSGMSFTEILRILAKNRDVYGETAEEVAVAVKDIDMFGLDFIEALKRLSYRTPSDDLEEFGENLASVLRSGRQLSSFLHDEYEYYREEAEAQQEQFLELLATIAEAYVTVFVAGPLFLITILVVVGLVMGGTLNFLRVFVYALIPLATAGFVVYLDSITEDAHGGEATEPQQPEPSRFRDVRTVDAVDTATSPGSAGSAVTGGSTVADGGVIGNAGTAVVERGRRARNEYRLHIYRQIQPIVRQLQKPLTVVKERPLTTLYVTVPLALLYLAMQWWPHLSSGNFTLGAYDDPLVHATLIVTIVFAVAYEFRRRRLRAIEMAIPDFLDRMASTNEAGMPIIDSFGRVVQSDLGALTPELRQTWADVQWGARMENALHRFQHRLNTPTVTRVVTLTTNAMNASGDLGPVLRIAADESQASRRLERDRRSEMLTYLVVIYLAFFVFLVIVIALDTIFIPNIPTGTLGQTGGGAAATPGIGGLQQVTQADKHAHRLLFFHTALVQAVCSGFVAGQMGEGDLKSGAKHASIMLILAYLTFLLFG